MKISSNEFVHISSFENEDTIESQRHISGTKNRNKYWKNSYGGYEEKWHWLVIGTTSGGCPLFEG